MYSCGTCQRQFANLRNRENHLHLTNHELATPMVCSLDYAINLRNQVLHCPLCSFKSKAVKTPRFFEKHFKKSHPKATLTLNYSCTVCKVSLTDAEAKTHISFHHQLKLAFTPPVELAPNSEARSLTPGPPSSPTAPHASPTTDMVSSPSPILSPNGNTPPTLFSQEPQDLLRKFLEVSEPVLSSPESSPDAKFSPSSTTDESRAASPVKNTTYESSSPILSLAGNSPPPMFSQEAREGTERTSPGSTTSPTPSISPKIPALMDLIIPTPNIIRQPNTIRQPNNPRPTAQDYFDLPPPTQRRTPPPCRTPPPPTMEDLDPDEDENISRRPQTLPIPDATRPRQRLASPLDLGPSDHAIPTAEAAHDLTSFREKWRATFSEDLHWNTFSAHCEAFATEGRVLAQTVVSNQRPKPTRRRPDRPTARPPIDNRRPTIADPVASRRIQQLYRLSKKRAARTVLGDDSPNFTGSTNEAFDFFSATFGQREYDTAHLEEELHSFVPTADPDDSMFDPPTPEELQTKLRAMANSAPGKDRLEYRHLRILDPKCEILAKIYHYCFLAHDVPAQWKTATTILIHKKGPTDEAGNFRPIALMSCLYKLLMSILARRMTSFSIENNLLSDQQKSARPNEGCYEHAYLVQSVVNDATRQQKNVCMAWLDIKNAFGSIPHAAMLSTLSHMGFPQPLVDLIENIYTGATTEVLTSTGPTPSIPIYSGVKQGCPLSAILFNLTMELILRRVNATAEHLPGGPPTHFGYPLAILAYADDIVLIARKKQDLQALLDAVSSAADTLDLTFRPDKCSSMSLTPRDPNSRVTTNSFLVQGKEIPALSAEDHYLYLGIPIGLVVNVTHLQTLVETLTDKLEKIKNSLLTPWQKLDAIRTFIQPCLTYAFRSSSPTDKAIQSYRKKLLEVVRAVCNLPTYSSTAYIFANRRSGGLGFQDPYIERDLQTTVQAVKILASRDPTVAGVARKELAQTVRFVSQCTPTPELTTKYLSNSPDRRLDKLRHRKGSLWTRTRRATKSLKVTIHLPAAGPPTVSTPDYLDPVSAPETCRFLHNVARDSAATTLRELPDQGKVARSLQQDRYANGSSWHFTGLNLRFKDWRFIHRARLNLLPTNALKTRWYGSNPSCRHCLDDETLPHVLNHCLTNMVAITERHDKIVSRLVNAVQEGTITTDQTVQDSGSTLRPDIVIVNDTHATIIDVCCPFDNGAEALEDAIAHKEAKYEHLRNFFTSKGLNCNIFGFAVGALGSWHPENEKTLSALGMSRRYKNLFRKLCCTDVIQGSCDIYRQHLGCDNEILN